MTKNNEQKWCQSKLICWSWTIHNENKSFILTYCWCLYSSRCLWCTNVIGKKTAGWRQFRESHLRGSNPNARQIVDTEMPFHSIFNSAETITCASHFTTNPLLLAQSALDLLLGIFSEMDFTEKSQMYKPEEKS